MIKPAAKSLSELPFAPEGMDIGGAGVADACGGTMMALVAEWIILFLSSLLQNIQR